MTKDTRTRNVISFLKSIEPSKLERILWKFTLKTGFHIELRGNTLIFQGGNPDRIIAEFYQFVDSF